MNYQLLLESFAQGTELTDQEIDLLSIELETQIINLKISKSLGCLNYAPDHICDFLKLKKKSLWIICLGEVIDIHRSSNMVTTRSTAVYHALFREGLIVG